MDRREFMRASTAAATTGRAAALPDKEQPGFPSPALAMKASREKFLFVTCSHGGTDIWEPDYLATIDVDPGSANYSKVVSRVTMPVVGDELFHFGWNVCSSSHKKWSYRKYLIVPGVRSGRIHIVDVEVPERLWMHKVIEPTAILDAAGCSAPFTARPLPTGEIMVSMLGDRPSLDKSSDRHGPGFLLLDEKFAIKGRWDPLGASGIDVFGDFWYQTGVENPVLISTSFAHPATFLKGFDPKDAETWWGYRGDAIRIWNWKDPTAVNPVSVGKDGQGLLPVRFLHNPTKPRAFVGAVLTGTIWCLAAGKTRVPTTANYRAHQVIQIKLANVGGKPLRPMTTDMVISMDDKFLYLSNWLHGDVRQYDISDPFEPKLTAQIFLGGLLGKSVEPEGKRLWGTDHFGKKLSGGPQSLQLSLDCKRLYVTNSFFSAWDNQFYPAIAKKGSWMVQIDCDSNKGGMKLNGDFFVDFGKEPCGPSRAREVHCDGGDCTSDIFV